MRGGFALVLAGCVVGSVCGCRRRGGDPTPAQVEPPSPSAAVPVQRGQVRDGVYVEPGAFSLPVPVGWGWLEGPPSGGLRLRVSAPKSELTVEVWRYTTGGLRPRPRGDCTWTWSDTGPYGGPGRGSGMVATCTPEDPSQARIFAWVVEDSAGGSWQLEGHVPPSGLVHGLEQVRSVVDGFQSPPQP